MEGTSAPAGHQRTVSEYGTHIPFATTVTASTDETSRRRRWNRLEVHHAQTTDNGRTARWKSWGPFEGPFISKEQQRRSSAKWIQLQGGNASQFPEAAARGECQGF